MTGREWAMVPNSPHSSFFSYCIWRLQWNKDSSRGGGGGRLHCLASEGVGIEAVCRCAAANGHLLSPCVHCHNRQGNSEWSLPAEKRPLLTAYAGRGPQPSSGECLRDYSRTMYHLKCPNLNINDTLWIRK